MLLALLVGWWFFLPDPLFRVPYSTVILDRDDEIMGMTVAEDGQFRVSGRGHLSAKYYSQSLVSERAKWFGGKRGKHADYAGGAVVTGESAPDDPGENTGNVPGVAVGTEFQQVGDSEYVRGSRSFRGKYRGYTGGGTQVF